VIKYPVVAVLTGCITLVGLPQTMAEQAMENVGAAPGVISFATPEGVFLIRPDGADRQPLTQNSDTPYNALAWSADGQQLAVVEGQDQVTLVNLETGSSTPIFSSQCTGSPAIAVRWQQPAQTLVIGQQCDQTASNASGQTDLWLTEPGGPMTSVALPADLASDLYLSPDGTQVAYVAGEHVYVAAVNGDNSDGNPPRRISQTPGNYGAAGSPLAWSPDGRQLAVYEGAYPFQRIHLVQGDGTDQQLLTPNPDFQIYRSRLHWSPDGNVLAFYQPFDPPFSNQEVIALIDIETQTVESLTGPGFFSGLSWSPDSQQLVFAFGEEINQQALFLLDLPSRDYTTLTSEAFQAILDSHWSPHGDWIAFTATPIGDELGTQVLHGVRPDGSDFSALTASDEYVYPFAWVPVP